MEELINRLEKATGPDPSLDGDIAFRMGLYARPPRVAIPLRYTDSIDAAATLVPVGLSWEARTSPIPNTSGADVWDWKAAENPIYSAVNCARPAIALCIAALKARAQGA